MSPSKAAFIMLPFKEIMSLQHRVGSLDNTPKAVPREA